MMTNLACEAIPIRVINQTDQALTIFILGRKIGDVNPGEELKNKNVSASFRDYLIEAKNTQGEVVFSKKYTFDELSRDLDYKVIISKSP